MQFVNGDLHECEENIKTSRLNYGHQRWTKEHVDRKKVVTQYIISAPASVAQVTETQCAPTGTVCRRSRGSIPRVDR